MVPGKLPPQLTDGSANQSNVVADTKADRVLISDDFVYWGGSGPPVAEEISELWNSGRKPLRRARPQKQISTCLC